VHYFYVSGNIREQWSSCYQCFHSDH